MSDAFRDAAGIFDSYRAAFARHDAAAIADHFAYPLHVASDAGEVGLTAVASRDEWIETLERLLAMYRAIDVASARILDLRVIEVTPRVVSAIIRWALDDSAGRPLYEFDAAYTLARIDGRPRIAAIAHDEVPRYRECVARLRAEGSEGR